MSYDITWRRIADFDNPEEAEQEHICTGLDERTLVARLMRVTKRGERIEVIRVVPNRRK